MSERKEKIVFVQTIRIIFQKKLFSVASVLSVVFYDRSPEVKN